MRIVKESLNEMNFQKKMDNPLGALGIGRKKMIEDWLEEQQIYAYHIINDDYSIDITEYGVDIRSIGLNVFPDYIQFNKINGFFNCCHNNLTSLRGCPIYYVKGEQLVQDHPVKAGCYIIEDRI